MSRRGTVIARSDVDRNIVSNNSALPEHRDCEGGDACLIDCFDDDEYLEEPGRYRLERAKDSLTVHIESHAPANLLGMMLELTEPLDWLAIEAFRPDLQRVDDPPVPMKVALDYKSDNAKIPLGWYPDATCSIKKWRAYIQIGKRSGWWLKSRIGRLFAGWWRRWKGELKYNQHCRTYVEVACVMHLYEETGDASASLVGTVSVPKTWNHNLSEWIPNEYEARQHLYLWERLALKLLRKVHANCKPRAEAAEIRNRLRCPSDVPKQEVQRPPPPSASGSTGDTTESHDESAAECPCWADDYMEVAGESGAAIRNMFPPVLGDNGFTATVPAGGGGGDDD